MWGGRGPVHAAYHRSRVEPSPRAGAAAATVHAAVRLPTCDEYADRQKGWPRCVRRNEYIRKGLVKESYRCGTRLTCLSADVVNGSREQVAVQRIRSKFSSRRAKAPRASPSRSPRSED